VVMGKERGQVRRGGSPALCFSPCQECNSHTAGIPSRSIPLAAWPFAAPRPFAATEHPLIWTTLPALRELRGGREVCLGLFASLRLNTARPRRFILRLSGEFQDSDSRYSTSQETATRGRASLDLIATYGTAIALVEESRCAL